MAMKAHSRFKAALRGAAALGLAFALCPAALASDAAADGGSCPGGRALRVALAEAGPFHDFQRVFAHMLSELARKGLVRSAPPSAKLVFDIPKTYKEIAEASQGGCVVFPEDALYNANWDPSVREAMREELRERVAKRGDIDLVLAFGTKSGLDFKDGIPGANVMVVTPTDPEASGITGRGEFSGVKGVHVQKEPGRYLTELKMFHEIFPFKSLGVILDDEEEGRRSQAAEAIGEFASQSGVRLVKCQGDVITQDLEKARSEFSRCCLELASGGTEAVYLTYGNGADPENLYSQIKPLIAAKIPTFSQSGIAEVRGGSLMALSDGDLEASGRFEAQVLEKIASGTPPEQISEYYHAPLMLGLNLKTASLIGWKPPFDRLIAVDVVFSAIGSN